MEDNSLPTSAFDQLLDILANVIRVARKQDPAASPTLTPQAKQELLQATNEFRDAMSRAQKIAANLPGGEIAPEDQDEVIQALEELRDRKRAYLDSFSGLVEQFKSVPHSEDLNTEMASK